MIQTLRKTFLPVAHRSGHETVHHSLHYSVLSLKDLLAHLSAYLEHAGNDLLQPRQEAVSVLLQELYRN